MEQADELVSIAPDQRLLLVTNLMQRYNPLFGQIKELVDSKLLATSKECRTYRFSVTGSLSRFFNGLARPRAMASPTGLVTYPRYESRLVVLAA
jgi:predicted dehydrogenase